MFSIRTSVIATIALIAVFAVALAGLLGYASAQSSTPLNLQSGDSALPTESRAVLGADSAQEILAHEYFHLTGTSRPGVPACPGSPGMSTTTMARPRRTWS